MILLGLVIAGLFVYLGTQRNEISPLFLPTGLPTRVPRSYALEGEAQFTSGNLPAAIQAYQQAIAMNPNDADVIAELARLQAYDSELQTNDSDRLKFLTDAKDNIDKATELAPDDSFVYTIRAFVYDWNATPSFAADNFQAYIEEAQQAILKATQLDPNNALALAYQAEILLDQQKWTQAEESINLALQRDQSQMDIYRVSGLVQESLGNYLQAIEEYKKAAAIAPNFTPLYIRIGTNYRTLGAKSTDTEVQDGYYNDALDYYAKAVSINKQIQVDDPIPYLSISKTYIQMGEFFAAGLNVRAALDMLPDNPDIYAQLGMVYRGARNYESSIPAFQCALEGCSADVSCEVRECDSEQDTPITVTGLPLSASTLVYYYTYGSILAGMDAPGNSYCDTAMNVFAEIRSVYSNDETTMSIIEPSEAICESLQNADSATSVGPTPNPNIGLSEQTLQAIATLAVQTQTETETPVPAPSETPEPSPTGETP